MAAGTITFGAVETRIRRDLVNDNDADQYRWSVAAVMSAMNQAVLDIATRINAWASYDDNGKRIYDLHTTAIESACDGNPPSVELTDEQITALRALVIPLCDRYADAIAYIAAAKIYMTDNSDTANAQKSASYLELGKELAQS